MYYLFPIGTGALVNDHPQISSISNFVIGVKDKYNFIEEKRMTQH
jgi:hypothetical protein